MGKLNKWDEYEAMGPDHDHGTHTGPGDVKDGETLTVTVDTSRGTPD